jgi:hypothetical protein
MALVNRYGLKRTQTPIASFSLFMEMVRVQLAPLNCNINSVVGEINPQRPRVEDCRTSTKLVGNADVRANFLNRPHHRAWEKFLEGAERVEVKFYSWS